MLNNVRTYVIAKPANSTEVLWNAWTSARKFVKQPPNVDLTAVVYEAKIRLKQREKCNKMTQQLTD